MEITASSDGNNAEYINISLIHHFWGLKVHCMFIL